MNFLSIVNSAPPGNFRQGPAMETTADKGPDTGADCVDGQAVIGGSVASQLARRGNRHDL